MCLLSTHEPELSAPAPKLSAHAPGLNPHESDTSTNVPDSCVLSCTQCRSVLTLRISCSSRSFLYKRLSTPDFAALRGSGALIRGDVTDRGSVSSNSSKPDVRNNDCDFSMQKHTVAN